MRKFSKTLLALLLVVLMVSGYIPFADFITRASAATYTVTTWQDLRTRVQNAANGDVIIVGANMTLGTLPAGNQNGNLNYLWEQVDVTKNITIKSADGQNYTLKRPQWHYHLSSDSGGNANTCKRPIFNIVSGATLTLENITLSGGSGRVNPQATVYSVSGIYVRGTLNLNSGATITGFSSENVDNTMGGNINIYPGGTLNMYDGAVISNGYSYQHGAAFANQGTANIYGGTITGNTAAAQGGAILNWDAGTLNFSGGLISGNTAGTWGGGISNLGTLNMTGGGITSNTARDGGGIQHQGSSTNNVHGGYIMSNRATRWGGGIYQYASVLNFQGCYIISNRADQRGDDLYYEAAGAAHPLPLPAYCPASATTIEAYYDYAQGSNHKQRTPANPSNSWRETAQYPRESWGYKFYQITLCEDVATIDTNQNTSISINVKSNDGPWITLNGLSNSLGGYSSGGFGGGGSGHLFSGARKFNSTTINTAHGTATISSSGVTFTVTDNSLHTEDWVDEFYYDAQCPISSNETNFSGVAKVTVTILANTDCLHTNYTIKSQTTATCTTADSTTYKCSDCGYEWTVTGSTNPNNHATALAHYAAVASNCVDTGNIEYWKCNSCNKYYNNSDGHSSHQVNSVVTSVNPNNHKGPTQAIPANPPTCTQAGTTAGTKCGACGATLTAPQTDPALGHNFQFTRTVAATCTAGGYDLYTCSRCSATEQRNATSALGHSWGSWTTGDANNHTRSCTRSGCNATDSAPHEWTQTGGTAGTCTTAGNATYKCDVCNRTKTEPGSTNPSNHTNLTHTAAVTATCTTNGNIEYWYCTGCHKYYNNSDGAAGHEITQASTVIAIDSNAHDWGNWTDAGANGHTRVCSRSASHTETVAHTYPSTWNQGNDTHHTKTCTVSTCAHVLSEEHTFGEWVVVTPAQVGVAGLKRHTCTVCGKVVDETIPALTNPQMTVDSVNTTQGSTVNVDVTLTGNTGIYAQNFVIYYPKTLTLNSITFSDDVYPSTEGELSSPLFMDPVTNARMEGYFDDAGITKAGNYGAAIYVDNGATVNSTDDGCIVTLSFTVPSGSSTTDYPIGIFGVYAPTDDAIDAAGNSLSMPVVYHNGSIHITNPQTECSTHTWGAWIDDTPATCTSPGERHHVCTVCGAVEYEYVPQGSHNYVDTVTAPTCTEAGYTTHVCSICGDTYTDTPVAALGHNFGSWTTVWTASGINGQLERRTCSRCGLFEERTTGSATNSGYSTSAAGTQTYQYELTDTVLPGHEYVIVNSNAAGTRKALYDNNGAQGSGNVTVSTSGGKTIVTAPNDTYVWNTYSGIYLQNKGTGDFLKAYNGTSGDNISLNLGITAASANTNDYKFNSNGYQSAGNYYLGYKDSITAVPTGVVTSNYAHPSGSAFNVGGWAYIKDSSYTAHGSEYEYKFDACFLASDSYLQMQRYEDQSDMFIIYPTSATLTVGGTTKTASYSSGTSNYGNHWQHFDIIVSGGKLTMYVDGVRVINNETVGTVNNHSEGIIFQNSAGTVYIDNFVIIKNGDDEICDADFSSYNPASANMGSGTSIVSVVSGWTNNQPSASVVATDVFTASTDANAAPRVYFYEKRAVNSNSNAPSYVYQRAESVVSGETYVLVSSPIEGAANELTGSAGTAAVTVYNDGVSYKPYVNTAAANEFVVTAAGTNSFIFNNTATNKFLTVNGAETTFSDDCKLTVKAVKIGENQTTPDIYSVNVAGTTYYLYNKTAITRIDSDLVDDVISVTTCAGALSNNNPVDIRANDHYTDRTAMTVVGLISALPSGVTAGNVFYASNAAAGTMANSLNLTNGTATLSNGAITFTAGANAAFAAAEDFYYVAQVDHLGAYIYGKVTIGARPAHTLTPHAAVPATCTEAGNSAYWSCSVCGKYFSDENGTTEIAADSWIIPATGHTPVEDAAVAPTCTETGLTAGSHCSVCGAILTAQEVVPATGHTPVTDEAVAPTCTETGLTAGSHCSVCGVILTAQEVVPATGHNWDNGTVTTQPTCTEAGVKTFTCQNDSSHTYTEPVAALGHDLTAHPAVAATCTEAGNSAYWSCSRCGKYFSDAAGTTEIAADSWIIAATGHTWSSTWITDNEGGGLNGYHHRFCTVCGEYDGADLSDGEGYGYSTTNDTIELYIIANSIAAGDEYVLIDRCTAGAGHLLALDGTTVNVTVYSDGVSYAPYVNVDDSNEENCRRCGNRFSRH